MAVQAQSKTPDSQKQRSAAAKASLNKSSVVPSSSSSDRKRIHPIIHLQKTIGNQAVQQLIKSGKIAPKMNVSNKRKENFKQKADKAATAGAIIVPAPSQVNYAKMIIDNNNIKGVSRNATNLNRLTPKLNSNVQRMESNHSLASELNGHSKQAAKPSSTVGAAMHKEIKQPSGLVGTIRNQPASPILGGVLQSNPMSMIPIRSTEPSMVARSATGRGLPSPSAPLPLALDGHHISQDISSIPLRSLRHVQMFSHVSLSTDPAEVEARMIAKKVMNIALPHSTNRAINSTGTAAATSAAATTSRGNTATNPQRTSTVIHRNANRQPGATRNIAEVDSKSAGAGPGSPLPSKVRTFMEPRFKEDFSNVRIHTGERPAQLSAHLNAQAFTVGRHIFFGKDQFKPESKKGQELIAHELTHTIQQGATTIKRSEDVRVTHQSPPKVQRLGISDALDYFAKKANNIPG
jgi:hypothetical protein